MDLVDLARIVLRRWYVVFPVMVLAIVGAVLIAVTTEPVYEARGTFLMTDPPTEDVAEEQDGTADAGLLAEILNLDPRASGGGGETSFEALAIDEGTVRVDAFAPSSQAVLDLLDEQLVAAEQAAGGTDAIEVLARPEEASPSTPDPEGPEVFQAAMLLRVADPEQTGSGPTVDPGYAGRVLVELMFAPDAEAQILEGTDGADYSVDRDDSGQAPIFGIDVEATSGAGAQEMFERTRTVAEDRLDRLQQAAGVGENDRLELLPLAAPEPESTGGDELRRPVLLVVGIGIVLALGLAAVVESIARTRARRRAHDGFVASRRHLDERDPAQLR